MDMSSESDSWHNRQFLELLGVQKLVNDMDSKEAQRLGLMTRPLTTAAIEKHLDDFGLEAEFGSHSLMKGLSGGQKVKVVLAAAMWNNPHIVVLDEPTNFLDRDSLGAMAMVRVRFPALRCCALVSEVLAQVLGTGPGPMYLSTLATIKRRGYITWVVDKVRQMTSQVIASPQ